MPGGVIVGLGSTGTVESRTSFVRLKTTSLLYMIFDVGRLNRDSVEFEKGGGDGGSIIGLSEGIETTYEEDADIQIRKRGSTGGVGVHPVVGANHLHQLIVGLSLFR